jgi:hypothetical protein
MKVLLSVAVLLAAVVWVSSPFSAPSTVDTFRYGEDAPWFIWRFVMPALGWSIRALERVEPPFVQVMRTLQGMQTPFLLASVVERRVPDILFERGRLTVRELAKLTKSDPEMLYRMLRRLTVHGYFREFGDEDDLIAHSFENTPSSDVLREDRSPSARYALLHNARDVGPAYLHIGRVLDDPLAHPWQIGHGMKTSDIWGEYFNTMHPDRGTIFNKFMESVDLLGGFTTSTDFDWKQCNCVVDYAGGKGQFLRAILKHNPSIAKGVVFDLAPVTAEGEQVWEKEEQSLRSKVTFASGSFFDNTTNVPLCDSAPTCYVMRNILHDWDDVASKVILKALAPRLRRDKGDRVMIVEFLPSNRIFPAVGMEAIVDTTMMTLGGKERTPAQMSALLEASGFNRLGPESVHNVRSFSRIAVATPK